MAACAEVIAHSLKGLESGGCSDFQEERILDLIEACRKVGIEFVLTRHEAAAAFMADVTGQMTGIPGVCLSTVGPGATNLVSGVANATLDRSPVFAFTAQVSTASQPYATHQFIRLERLFEPVTKKTFVLTGRGTERMIQDGSASPLPGRKGLSTSASPAMWREAKKLPEKRGTLSLALRAQRHPLMVRGFQRSLTRYDVQDTLWYCLESASIPRRRLLRSGNSSGRTGSR